MSNGIIIAAGQGSRMGLLTKNIPKCLLEVRGKSLLNHSIENMKSLNCSKINVVVGYKKEKISSLGINKIENKLFLENNVLHSLFQAKDFMNETTYITYSDIWVNRNNYLKLQKCEGDITIVIDEDWKKNYQNRKLHPMTEAEKVILNKYNYVTEIGKNISDNSNVHEFIGLLKLSAKGSEIFVNEFKKISLLYNMNDKFYNAKEFKKAYLTDFILYLIDKSYQINTLKIRGGWSEFDTQEDIDLFEKRQYYSQNNV